LVKEPLAHLGIDGEAVGHLVDGGIRIVAAQPLEPGRQLTVPLQGLGRAVSRRHLLGKAVHLLLHPEHPFKGRAQHILHGVSVGIHWDLGDQTHPAVGGHHYLSLIVVQFSGEDTK